MKKRVSIYIDDEAWENLKDHAWRARKSASLYLEDLITGVIPFKGHVESQAENLELKKEIATTEASDAVLIADAQARLDAERSRRNIKSEKIEKFREDVKGLMGHSGPRPKVAK